YVTYNIRAAYGVPTPEHHEGVFAYYFYRLIQRAENVWMIYCSHADDKTTGEASRYIYQLDYESPLPISYINVGVDVNLYDSSPIEIAKVGEVDRILSQYTDAENPKSISPSAINRYVACPMRFYFYHIANIRGGDALSEDVDNSMFGNILHEAICHLYESVIKQGDTKQGLNRLLKDRIVVEREVVAAIRNVCKVRDSVADDHLAGDLQLIKDIVVKYIADGVVAFDATSPIDFQTISVEKVYSYPLELPSGERIIIEGTLDRVDELSPNKLRVIDYKSGGKHLEFKSIEALFEGEGAERQGHIIQTLTYSMMLHHTLGVQVVPSLYYVRFMNQPNYSPLLINKSIDGDGIASYQSQSEEFEEYLKKTLAELLDRSTPFRQIDDKDGSCSYCDFRQICRV
ncbi:MAG: PD-(D/E)XK nuclease family protein, partial [Rikenellaceae bacterium]